MRPPADQSQPPAVTQAAPSSQVASNPEPQAAVPSPPTPAPAVPANKERPAPVQTAKAAAPVHQSPSPGQQAPQEAPPPVPPAAPPVTTEPAPAPPSVPDPELPPGGRYRGPPEGSVAWFGTLAPRSTLVMAGSRASSGAISGPRIAGRHRDGPRSRPRRGPRRRAAHARKPLPASTHQQRTRRCFRRHDTLERETRVNLRILPGLTLAAALALGFPMAAAETGSRRALLLGNASYQKLKPLPASQAGARELARTLAALQFQTQVVEDVQPRFARAGRSEVRRAVAGGRRGVAFLWRLWPSSGGRKLLARRRIRSPQGTGDRLRRLFDAARGDRDRKARRIAQSLAVRCGPRRTPAAKTLPSARPQSAYAGASRYADRIFRRRQSERRRGRFTGCLRARPHRDAARRRDEPAASVRASQAEGERGLRRTPVAVGDVHRGHRVPLQSQRRGSAGLGAKLLPAGPRPWMRSSAIFPTRPTPPRLASAWLPSTSNARPLPTGLSPRRRCANTSKPSRNATSSV